jgi:hypothetical protein
MLLEHAAVRLERLELEVDRLRMPSASTNDANRGGS